MIKRCYFMAVKKIHGDGNGSYSFNGFTVTRRSFFPAPLIVYEKGLEHAKEQMKDKPGDILQIESFSRI